MKNYKHLLEWFKNKQKGIKQKKVLLIFLWIVALFDTITFFSTSNFAFEVNPVYVLTESIGFLLVVKFGLLIGLSWILWNYKPQPKRSLIFAYGLVFVTILAILVQGLGGYSNLKLQHDVESAPPGDVIPMEKSEALKTYILFEIMFFFYPMIVAFTSFWIFEKIYF